MISGALHEALLMFVSVEVQVTEKMIEPGGERREEDLEWLKLNQHRCM